MKRPIGSLLWGRRVTALAVMCAIVVLRSANPDGRVDGVAPASPPRIDAVTIVDLGVLDGATYGAAIDINNDGLVVGYSGGFPNYCCGFIPPQPHGFLWNPATGLMHDLGVSMRAFGGGINSYGYSINDDGLIAGYAREAYFDNVHYLFTSEASDVLAGPAWQPFVSSTWTMTIQGSLGFVTIPQDVNASRVVVGTSTSSPQQAFVWDETAGIRALPTLGPGHSAANGINDAGVIVGWGSVGGVSHPLRWDAATGNVEDLGLPAGWQRAVAEDVNASGIVTGHGLDASGATRAFVWSDATGFTVLGTLGGPNAWAQGINGSGKVVGFSVTADAATRAFAWDPATDIMVDLGVLPGDGSSNAFAINDQDQIVGRSLGSVERPVLWTVTFSSPDAEPPTVTCSAPDGIWHATDVTLLCAATDAGSGLANSSDSNFTLTTSVPAGVENANASTDLRTVCDNAGNCATAGPISGNKVDKLAPSVTITVPASGAYLLNQTVTANYACADGSSGIASCAGPVAAGAAIDTSSVGIHTFQVTAIDAAGNTTVETRTFTVGYNVCILFDQSKAHKTGSTIPIKLQLCNAAGVNLSTAAVALTATSVYQVSTNAPGPLEDSGNANPDVQFRFDVDKYIFNLSLTGFTQGTYVLMFTAGSDPTPHSVQFQVK